MAQYILRISFAGNNVLNEKKLAELLAVEPGQKLDPQLIEGAIPRILDEYKRRGYIFSKIEWEANPAEGDQVEIRITIHEGKIVKMGKVEISGNTIFSKDKLLNMLDFRRNPFFDEAAFQKDMEQLLKLYSDNGHPLVKISPSGFQVENDRLNIKLNIDEGPLVRIHQVQISGLKKTRQNIIMRELAVLPGDIFHQRKIDESQQRLYNMGYFQSVRAGFTPVLASKLFGKKFNQKISQTSEDAVNLDFSVSEGRTGRFSGVLGYNPLSEDTIGGQKFTGMLEAVETNLLGTGRQLSIKGRFGLIDTYEFSYEEPWAFNAPVNVGIRLWGTQYEMQDSGLKTQDASQDESSSLESGVLSPESSKEWAGSLSMAAHTGRFVEGSLALTYKRIYSPPFVKGISDYESSRSEGVLPVSSADFINGQKYSLTLGVQRDSRDYFINPSEGRLDRASVEISRGDFKLIKIWLDLNQYFKVQGRQVLAMGFHGARIWGDVIPITETLTLGGANTLRGYSEDFFRGEGRIFANCEYRLLVSRDSQFFIFLDVGSVYDREYGLSPLKLGYGVGMRLRSQTGLISMDYGLARGDPILSGKIHVSLGIGL